jgi:hypothetical protein
MCVHAHTHRHTHTQGRERERERERERDRCRGTHCAKGDVFTVVMCKTVECSPWAGIMTGYVATCRHM